MPTLLGTSACEQGTQGAGPIVGPLRPIDDTRYRYQASAHRVVRSSHHLIVAVWFAFTMDHE